MTKMIKEQTHWVSLFIDRNTALYFDSFGIENIPLEILNRIRAKSTAHSIFREQDNESIMCGFYCIAFTEYVLAGKSLLDYTNLFSPNDYKKNHKIIYQYFKDKYGRRSKSEFKSRKIDETRNYFLDQMKHNDLMSEKYIKICKYLNYDEHLLILQLLFDVLTNFPFTTSETIRDYYL